MIKNIKSVYRTLTLLVDKTLSIEKERSIQLNLEDGKRHLLLLAEIKELKEKYTTLQDAYMCQAEAIRVHVTDPKQFMSLVATSIENRKCQASHKDWLKEK